MTRDRPNGSAPAPMPTFAELYRALNGRDPFPWQRRLAEQVAATEQWPAEVGVPTGLGKTACLDIAVWWLASQADRAPVDRTAPTRIWWVVNRRLLVDSTAEHAEGIARAFTDPDSANVEGQDREVVARVAQRLGSLSAAPGASPLEVIRLRGGVSSRTPTDPSRPAILLCTLPMYGSRLLFRGYGSNQRLRVVDAAMAGTDSLVLLDEAHLAPHLKALLPALADCPAVTGGRYTDCRVDPESLQVEVREAGGTWRSAALLSHGTAEQIYLLLRLALARHLVTDGEVCPLILDDAAAACDAERKRALLETLHAVSAGTQVILFTHEEDVQAWARQRLSAPRDALTELSRPS